MPDKELDSRLSLSSETEKDTLVSVLNAQKKLPLLFEELLLLPNFLLFPSEKVIGETKLVNLTPSPPKSLVNAVLLL